MMKQKISRALPGSFLLLMIVAGVRLAAVAQTEPLWRFDAGG